MPTTYTFLGDYNNQGKYDRMNLDENDIDIKETVSPGILSEIKQLLPERNTVVTTHPDWIRKSDILTQATCEIKLTYISEGAGYKNALSYYVYDINNPPARFGDIDEVFILFPNASSSGSGGQMNTGDTLKLVYEALSYDNISGNKRHATSVNHIFPPGIGIGFIVHANQWKNNGRSSAFLSVGHLMYSSDPNLNPESTAELSNHFVNYQSIVDPTKIIYGIEDIHRNKSYCDHDFNDLTFYLTPSPLESIDPVSYNSTNRQHFSGTILCEDLLNKPNADLDYNDFVAEYEVTENISDDKLLSIVIKIHGMNRGATLTHDFGVVIPNIKGMEGVKIFREEHVTHLDKTTFHHETFNIYGKGTDMVPIVKNTAEFLPHNSSWATNTITGESEIVPSHAILKIVFPTGGIDRSEINNSYFPYKFYLKVFRDDYHMWDLFSDVKYSDVTDEAKAKGVFSRKKILIIPDLVNFCCPIERQPLKHVYYRLLDYLAGDSRFRSWHQPKWARNYLLHSRVDPTDPHICSKLLDDTIASLRSDMLVLPNDTSGSWGEEDIKTVLTSQKCETSDVLKWDDISVSNVEDVAKFIQDFGNMNVKHGDDYKDSGSKNYYIGLTSTQTDQSRTVHSTIAGLSETVELLSSVQTHPFYIVRTDSGSD